MSEKAVTAEVLIVGAGPVGLCLAIDLGQRGIATVIVDRKPTPLRLPKMERSNPRTMEIFRRLGMVDAVRRAGLPSSKPMDVYIVASLDRPPLARIPYPSVDEARAEIASNDDGTLPREPYQLISQYNLEPLLIERLTALPSVRFLASTEFIEFEQDAEGVRAVLRDCDNGDTLTVQSAFLVAADGAGSSIRDQLGIRMEGQTDLGTVTNVFFRCDDLLDKSAVAPGRHYAFASVDVTGGAAGSMVVQDDQRHFAYHTPEPPETDMVDLLRRVTGLEIDPEILHVGRWTQNMLVADRHSRGRVFLVGDANHIYIPAGGLGMNTGVADAANLAWKLAAVVKGWGGDHLLESYSVERNAVARRTLAFVAHAVEGAALSRKGFTPMALEDTPRGADALKDYVERAAPLLRRVYDMHGADLGYRYVSPIVAIEQDDPPQDDAYLYRPSTWPGCHLPHIWLEHELSLYDQLGQDFTLLKLGSDPADSTAIEAAFGKLGIPLTIVEVPGQRARDLFERDLVIVRPDLHVAWRGDAPPDDPMSVAEKLVGIVAGKAV